MIYLDNAATTWPKPPGVATAMTEFLQSAAGNPGRSGHRLSLAAGRVVYDVRESLAEFFGLADPLRLIFTSGVTESVNLALCGLLSAGDHVVTSSMEHNAVMRTLRGLEQQGIRLTVVPCNGDGSLDVAEIEAALSPSTRMVVLTHASNVCGTILPIAEIGAITTSRGMFLLVDAAQTAGIVPIHIQTMKIDLLAFSGHKGLLGPTGTGGLVLGDRVDAALMVPLKRGGTGSESEQEEQPEFLPDKFESGTPNALGLAGLKAGLDYIREVGLSVLRQQEFERTVQLLEGLREIPGLKLYGPDNPERQVAVLSLAMENRSASEIAFRLDEEFGILTRPGLHCAPAAHRTLGTFPEGTVRLSPGPFTTNEEIATTIAAIAKLAQEGT